MPGRTGSVPARIAGTGKTIGAVDESALRDLIPANLEDLCKLAGVKEAWAATEPEIVARTEPGAPSGKITLQVVHLSKLRVEIVEKRGFRRRFPDCTLHEVARLQKSAKAMDPLAEPTAGRFSHAAC